ncbi:HemK2/MTQ2 family protein methyltransferase [Nocardia sp. R7R-8]|uniref:HemK2/MTQ2 family protein methyltransferase n=1 Tax=Nocardia sp. R7R-8 TaxID=3459304 RepID=UPI00403DB993
MLVDPGVYAPQHDSRLLIQAMKAAGVLPARKVLDLCTGSGVIAVAAAQAGASHVTALDVCPRAVGCAQRNATRHGLNIDVRHGVLDDAIAEGPYDVVTCNPPYVPGPVGLDEDNLVTVAGPSVAWNAGPDGRDILNPLCDSASELLVDGGTLLVVQSEYAGIQTSIASLRKQGLNVEVVARKLVPFGPVLTARTAWLQERGLCPARRRWEELVVIRADK